MNAHPHRRQSGAALIVALIMLLISTVLGLASIRATGTQERMNASMFDRSLAYQAAEAALRAAEVALEADQSLGIDCTATAANFCPPVPANTFTNGTTGWTNVSGDFLVNDDLLAATPQFYIEKMGEVGGSSEFGMEDSANCANYAGCDPSTPLAAQYRITGRSGALGADGRSVVALQITVKQNL